jgi:dihydrofolate synthase/folylpolyglutamate synthase
MASTGMKRAAVKTDITIETVTDAFSYIESFTNLERRPISPVDRNYRLDRMSYLLAAFQNPHEKIRCLHIAGTKAKGSTAAMLASVLEAAGYKTGLYASPHVSSYLERIQVSLAPPEGQLVVDLTNEVRRRVGGLESELPGGFAPTTFELLTLLGFLVFRASGCEIGVIEVGIGGRLDATNVITPVASLITPLDLEHTHLLGDTVEKIAREKGGIIKPGVPVFCSRQLPEAKLILSEIGRHRNAPVYFLDEELEDLTAETSLKGTRFSVKLKGETHVSFRLRLRGLFQAENAALTYLTLRKLFPHLDRQAFYSGFDRVFLPGRMEILDGEPPLILDGAHTPLSIEKMMESFKILFKKKGILIFGSVAGKTPDRMARILAPHFEQIIISTPGTFKKSDPDEVYRFFKSLHGRTHLEKDPAQALEKAREQSLGELPILVTGSFYMVSEIRKLAMPDV